MHVGIDFGTTNSAVAVGDDAGRVELVPLGGAKYWRTVLYFEQSDNLTGKGTYRMYIAKASEDRLVVEVENVTTLRYLLVPVLHAGEIQSIYFLDRESDNVWRYYGMVRTGKEANHLIARNESSAVNRAAALYRHFVGLPTDQEPPAAP